MSNRPRPLFAVASGAIIAGISGCAAWGDFLVPANSNSAWDGRDIVCVSVKHAATTESGGSALMIKAGEEVFSWAYGALVDAVETEGKRYAASYSGRQGDHLYQVVDGKLQVIRKVSVSRGVVSGRGASKENKLGCAASTEEFPRAFQIDFDIEQRGDGTQNAAPEFRVVPTHVSLRGTKAKALGVGWQPWSWLVATRRDYGRVDISVQLAMKGPVTVKDGVVKDEEWFAASFPLGKLDLPDEGEALTLDAGALAHLGTAWFQMPSPLSVPGSLCSIPKSGAPSCEGGKFGRVEVVATVAEANDLGDVIAKQVKSARDKEEERKKDALDWLKKELEKH